MAEAAAAPAGTKTIRLVGSIPPEVWNRLGTKVLPKLRSEGTDVKVGIELSVTVKTAVAGSLASEFRQILNDLGIADKVQIRDA